MHGYSGDLSWSPLGLIGLYIHEMSEAFMPNMDYPGPCLSCISDNCELWDENYSEKKDEKSDGKDKKD